MPATTTRPAGRAEMVADPDEVERLLAIRARANPTLHPFVRIPHDADGRPYRPSRATAIEHGFRAVRGHQDARVQIEGGQS